MRRMIFIVFLSTMLLQAGAQSNLKFQSQNYIGLLEGDHGSAFQFLSINGIQRKTWFLGLGSGIDWYLYRSIPVFLSVNKDWKPSNRTFYLSLDGGANFAWESRERNRFNDFISYDFMPGLFWGAGIGYKLRFKNNGDAITLNLGYNYKRIKEERVVPTLCNNPPCANLKENYDYRMSRISLRFGWLF